MSGQTDAGRYLIVILADKGHGHYKVVTASARDMTDVEKRTYRRMRR